MKLPINGFLWTAILGLAGTSGWQFYLAVTESPDLAQSQTSEQQNRQRFDGLIQDGIDSAGRVSVGPAYADDPFWNAFRNANFNGALPPPPPIEEGAGDTDVQDTPKNPLEEIFAILLLVSDAGRSRVVIQYQPASGVIVPESGGAAPVPVGPGDTTPRGPGTVAQSLPTFASTGGPVQHLVVEETLWAPFDPIRLVRVAEDASHAVFVREDAAIPKEEWTEETLYPEALDLPQDVLEALRLGLGVETNPNEARGSGPVKSSGIWVKTEETVEIEGRFNIGTRDQEMFRRESDVIFNRDLGTSNYHSAHGSVRGVMITRVAPRLSNYGVRSGDIVTAINGEAVRSKTEAIRVAKRLYRRGVRTFEVEFQRRGQCSTRTYVAPD